VTRFTDPLESPDHKRLATWLIKYAQTLSDGLAHAHPALPEYGSPSRTSPSVTDTNSCKMLSKKLAKTHCHDGAKKGSRCCRVLKHVAAHFHSRMTRK
jgi:hypothetical protein